MLFVLAGLFFLALSFTYFGMSIPPMVLGILALLSGVSFIAMGVTKKE